MLDSEGSHTIGQARCTTFRSRVYNDSNINSSFATSKQSSCPRSGSDDQLSPLDTSTPSFFDGCYYKNLVGNKGLLHSDQELFNGGSTDSQVSNYAKNPTKFFTDFATAMVKMGSISPLLSPSGEVRVNCRKTNWSILRSHWSSSPWWWFDWQILLDMREHLAETSKMNGVVVLKSCIHKGNKSGYIISLQYIAPIWCANNTKYV